MDSKNFLGLWSLHNQFMNVIITWQATSDESIIFTRDDHNHV